VRYIVSEKSVIKVRHRHWRAFCWLFVRYGSD